MTQRQRRTFALRVEPNDDDDHDDDAGDLEFPAVISTEAPVERGGYTEILSHAPGAVDLSRAPLPLIESHDSSRVNVGLVDDLRVEGRKLRGTVRFGQSARALELARDVKNKIVRGLSVGYEITEHAWDRTRSVLTATGWTPYETSVVSVPADTEAGFYRGRVMDEIPEGGTLSRTQRAAARRTVEGELRAAEIERNRAADVAALAARHGMSHRVSDWLSNGLTREQIHEEILTARASPPFRQPAAEQLEHAEREALRETPTARSSGIIPIEELRKYDLRRAILGSLPDAEMRAKRAAAFEMEISATLANHLGKQARGFLVPDEIFFGSRTFNPRTRTMLAGTPSAGGDLVGTVLLADEYISALANQPQVQQLGARVLTGLVGNVAVPREVSGLTPTWAGEATDAANSQPVFDQPSLQPHDLSVNVQISRRLLQQSTPAVDELVRGDIARYLNIGVDAAAINGSGSSNQPLGILNTSGIGVVPLGTNGAAPTWNAITECVQDVAVGNALLGSLGWLVNGATMGCLMRTPYVSTYPRYLFEADPRDQNAGSIAGYSARVSNSCPSNLTKGSGTGLSALIYGNWNEVIIGVWGGVDLIIDPYTYSRQGTLQITAWRTIDVLIRHAVSFAAIVDAVTT